MSVYKYWFVLVCQLRNLHSRDQIRLYAYYWNVLYFKNWCKYCVICNCDFFCNHIGHYDYRRQLNQKIHQKNKVSSSNLPLVISGICIHNIERYRNTWKVNGVYCRYPVNVIRYIIYFVTLCCHCNLLTSCKYKCIPVSSYIKTWIL